MPPLPTDRKWRGRALGERRCRVSELGFPLKSVQDRPRAVKTIARLSQYDSNHLGRSRAEEVASALDVVDHTALHAPRARASARSPGRPTPVQPSGLMTQMFEFTRFAQVYAIIELSGAQVPSS